MVWWQGNGIRARMAATAIVAVAVMVSVLFCEKSLAEDTVQQAAPVPHVESKPGEKPEKPTTNTPLPTKVEDKAAVTPKPDIPVVQPPLTAVDPQDAELQPVEEAIQVEKNDTTSKAVYPSFDHVRIEPNGENVFAGRVAAGATVEMMRNGEVYARAVADTSGLFALSAPPLPVGSSKIYLQSIAPDGTREHSRESVRVRISRDNTRRPLVALTSPDKPMVVLSNPESPESPSPASSGKTPGQAVARPTVQIVSVEPRENGRLFVSGLAAPGAAIKLYLNGAMVAPGGADGEGRLSFIIARGMVAGRYLVRLDDVDPVSGQVKSKAEVNVTIPDLSAYHAGAGDNGAPGAADRPSRGQRKVTVARGDSLWSLYQRYYGSGYHYPTVYDANMRILKNRDTIYPGQVLYLKAQKRK